MKFKVTRTSLIMWDDKKPCEEAFPSPTGTDWYVEINTLSELIQFQEKYGKVILKRNLDNPQMLELEIYDYYRE